MLALSVWMTWWALFVNRPISTLHKMVHNNFWGNSCFPRCKFYDVHLKTDTSDKWYKLRLVINHFNVVFRAALSNGNRQSIANTWKSFTDVILANSITNLTCTWAKKIKLKVRRERPNSAVMPNDNEMKWSGIDFQFTEKIAFMKWFDNRCVTLLRTALKGFNQVLSVLSRVKGQSTKTFFTCSERIKD